MLSVSAAARYEACTPQAIRNRIKRGELPATTVMDQRNRTVFQVPFSALSEAGQKRWLAENRAEVQQKREPQAKPLEMYTAAEREEIGFWIDTLERWQAFRNMPEVKSKTQVDRKFVLLFQLDHPDIPMSEAILYRKLRAYKASDLDGLLDKRGKWRKGKTDMPDKIWQVFLTYYLDEAQHPIAQCINYTRWWAQEHAPELVDQIPSYSTFRRHTLELAEPVKVMGREGAKAYYDRCSLYVRRTYEDMESNDWWVADNHTFDVQSQDASGKIHRLHLTAFFDARSGIFTGCHVTNNPCSQATLIALRKGIQKYGIPRNIYVDNGREFLTYDIGGLGHRAKRKFADGTPKFEPPGVFKRLGINMTNALVRNARAKVVERRFRDVKDHFSRLFETFTGGNVTERPDKLSGVLKNGVIPTDDQLTEVFETLMDFYFNQQVYNGEVARDRGMTREQVFWKNLHGQRLAREEDLNLMLMRSSRLQTVGRRGVFLNIGGVRIDYYDETLRMLQGQKVYLRYDPENLDTVRIYDTEDKFLMEVARDNKLVLPYGASQDQVKEAQRQVRHAEKVVKQAVAFSTLPMQARTTALELVLAQAGAAKEMRLLPDKQMQTIELHQAQEQPLLQAVGSGMDITRMVRNASKKKTGMED
ncbi:Mu transposase C-terminal domain-containing protein [Ruminococcaceae bacterium OttesenSCG-928-D13]|nr:Mu transposase C-terminal domain-containing protein [Ruminococcaceae bacterium OttesenSCG-928-D13]